MHEAACLAPRVFAHLVDLVRIVRLGRLGGLVVVGIHAGKDIAESPLSLSGLDFGEASGNDGVAERYACDRAGRGTAFAHAGEVHDDFGAVASHLEEEGALVELHAQRCETLEVLFPQGLGGAVSRTLAVVQKRRGDSAHESRAGK